MNIEYAISKNGENLGNQFVQPSNSNAILDTSNVAETSAGVDRNADDELIPRDKMIAGDEASVRDERSAAVKTIPRDARNANTHWWSLPI